jgi:hypothetical protein
MSRSSVTWPTLEQRRLGIEMRRCAARNLAAATLVMAVASCASDSTAPVPAADASRLFWAVVLDQHAVTLSTVPPYDTFQLRATARSSSGAVLEDAPAPRFISTDVGRVQVDGAGVLHAVRPGTNVVVIAVDTVDDIVHADTVRVTVTTDAAPPVLATLAFPLMDSTKFALGGTLLFGDSPGPLTVQASDAAGNAITALAVHYASSDPRIATIDPVAGVPTLRQPGSVTFTASATGYGVTKAATLPFTVGLPVNLAANITQTVVGGDSVITVSSPATIAVGGTIVWLNNTSVPTAITFEDPASALQDDLLCQALTVLCGNGNIDAFVFHTGDFDLAMRARQFRAPGTYRYHIGDFTGTIIVKQE